MCFLCSGYCWTLRPWKESPPFGQNKVPGSLRAHLGSVPLPAQVNALCHCVLVAYTDFLLLTSLPTAWDFLACFFSIQHSLLSYELSDVSLFSSCCLPLSCCCFLHQYLSFSGIRFPWSPHRLCSSWWQRRAWPACPPAWGRFIPTTVTPTASCTSPTPRRTCSEPLTLLPARPAEPEAHK